VLRPEWLRSLAREPLIFAMSNPDPEIRPELVEMIRPDAIVATGRSNYPNQINNVLCFPYIFRGALDVGAREINESMKLAAAEALASQARARWEEAGLDLKAARNCIIPDPFDTELLNKVGGAVSRAACDSGVAREALRTLS